MKLYKVKNTNPSYFTYILDFQGHSYIYRTNTLGHVLLLAQEFPKNSRKAWDASIRGEAYGYHKRCQLLEGEKEKILKVFSTLCNCMAITKNRLASLF